MADGIKRVYRVNKIVSESIHRPFIKDAKGPMVLYTKVDGYKANNKLEGNEEFRYKDREKYNTYLTKKESTYNSPRNIRRLFIGNDNIGIQYYSPVISNGKSTGITFDVKKYYGESIRSLLSKQDARIKDNIFNLMCNPWMCSNIEEIYISTEIFDISMKSDDVIAGLQQKTGLSALQLGSLSYGMITNKQNKVIKDGNAPEVLNQMMCLALGDKRKSFKRLRVVGVLCNIDEILTSYVKQIDKVSDILNSTWILNNANMRIIKEVCNSALIYFVSKDDVDITYFTCSSNMYKYDERVLYELFNIYRKSIDDEILKKKYGETFDEDNNSLKDEINTLLMDMIDSKERKHVFYSMLLYVLSKEKIELLNSLMEERTKREYNIE